MPSLLLGVIGMAIGLVVRPRAAARRAAAGARRWYVGFATGRYATRPLPPRARARRHLHLHHSHAADRPRAKGGVH